MAKIDLFSSGWVTRLGVSLARIMPRAVGYGLADTIAWGIKLARTARYRAVLDNLRHVVPETTEQTLKRMAFHVFSHAGRTYYDFYRVAGRRDYEALQEMVLIDDEIIEMLLRFQSDSRGALLLGAHISNFDLGAMALASRGVQMYVLSLSSPPAGFQVINRLRAQGGLEIEPISPRSLRSALRRLSQGGLVVTGVDRPIGPTDQPVTFFGTQALLPTGYIHLALRTNARVLVGCCYAEEGGRYRVHVDPPFELVRTGDRQRDEIENVQRILAAIERLIRRHPEQWMMFVPVWPS